MPRPDGVFELAPGLTGRGIIPIGDAVTLVLAEWDVHVKRGQFAPSTLATHSKVIATLKSFATNSGALTVADIDSSMLHDWIYAPSSKTGTAPTANMTALRKTVARAMFRTFAVLGITDHDVTTAVAAIRRPPRAVAPLTAAQVEALKQASIRQRGEHSGSSKAPAALALALLGLQSKEIPATRVNDVDFLAGTVWAHDGGARYFDRLIPIDDAWAWATLAERVQYLHSTSGPLADEAPLAYEKGKSRGGRSADNPAAATSNTLDKIFKDAGVKQPGRTRVASLNEYVANRVYERTSSFVEVAARLGMSSLDAVAHIVHDGWLADRMAQGPTAMDQ